MLFQIAILISVDLDARVDGENGEKKKLQLRGDRRHWASSFWQRWRQSVRYRKARKQRELWDGKA
jgi:hypothetical protein